MIHGVIIKSGSPSVWSECRWVRKTVLRLTGRSALTPLSRAAAARRTRPVPASTMYELSSTTTATDGPARSGSGSGVPVPSMTTCVRVGWDFCAREKSLPVITVKITRPSAIRIARRMGPLRIRAQWYSGKSAVRKCGIVKRLFSREAVQAARQFSNRISHLSGSIDCSADMLQRPAFKFCLGKVQGANHHLEGIIDGVRDFRRNQGVALELLQLVDLFQRADVNRYADDSQRIARDQRPARGQPVDPS